MTATNRNNGTGMTAPSGNNGAGMTAPNENNGTDMTATNRNNGTGMTAPSGNNGAAWQVYLLRCADMSLYCGITTDLPRRIDEHNAGTASRCTRSRRPVALAAAVPAPDKGTALRMELRVKKAPAGQKIELLKTLGMEYTLPQG